MAPKNNGSRAIDDSLNLIDFKSGRRGRKKKNEPFHLFLGTSQFVLFSLTFNSIIRPSCLVDFIPFFYIVFFFIQSFFLIHLLCWPVGWLFISLIIQINEEIKGQEWTLFYDSACFGEPIQNYRAETLDRKKMKRQRRINESIRNIFTEMVTHLKVKISSISQIRCVKGRSTFLYSITRSEQSSQHCSQRTIYPTNNITTEKSNLQTM